MHAFLQDLFLWIDRLVQERRNSIANALESRLSCSNRSICCPSICVSVCKLTHVGFPWETIFKLFNSFLLNIPDGVIPLYEPMFICHWSLGNELQRNCNQNINFYSRKSLGNVVWKYQPFCSVFSVLAGCLFCVLPAVINSLRLGDVYMRR